MGIRSRLFGVLNLPKLRLLFTGVASLVGSDALSMLFAEDHLQVPDGACVVSSTVESTVIGVLRAAQIFGGNASSCLYAANLTVAQ